WSMRKFIHASLKKARWALQAIWLP
ncbi:aromatic amino acid lyase family protein, partial [Vibrio parahaemolyticus V-223/04]